MAQGNIWTQLSPSGTAPVVRAYHGFVWSPEALGLYIFAGYDGTASSILSMTFEQCLD